MFLVALTDVWPVEESEPGIVMAVAGDGAGSIDDSRGAGPAGGPVAYRQGSQAAGVCEWVLARRAWTMFELKDVPASPQVAAKTLSEMARRDPRVERVTKGWYIRVAPPGTTPDLHLRDEGKEAIVFAGPGSGYAAFTSVGMVGWIWRTPIKMQICVVGRAPRATLKFCEFVSRSNQARRSLTWAEVSLLEALRYFRYAGYEWDECVEWVAEGFTTQRLGSGALIRASELRRVGEMERDVDDEFRSRLRSLTDSIPPTVAYQRSRR